MKHPLRRYRVWFALFGLGLALGCDRRFDFDTTSSAGAGSANAGAGSGAGGSDIAGAATGGTGGGGGGGAGGTGGVVAGSGGDLTQGGTSGGGAAGSGGEPAGCGTLGPCPSGAYCVDGQCVQCEADGDCAAYSLKRCLASSHRCVACTSSSDCLDDFACDTSSHRCLRKCEDNLTCPPTTDDCDQRRLVCPKCDTNAECTEPGLRFCAADGSGCVQCLKQTDCNDGKQCDTLTGRCVGCRAGADCSSGICDPSTFTCTP